MGELTMLEKWKELLALAAAAEQEVAAELPDAEQDYQRALERLNFARERLKFYSRLRNANSEVAGFLEAEAQRTSTLPPDPANNDMTQHVVFHQEDVQ